MSEYPTEEKPDDQSEGNTGNDVDKSTDPGPVPGEGDEQK